MAAYFNLTLDTTAPASPSVSINSGDAATGSVDVTLTIGTSDSPTTGYAVRIYGDVDDTHAPTEYRAAQVDAPWVSYATSKSVRLSTGDGSKTVNIEIRDDVGNVSTTASDSITLDTTATVVTVTSGPSASKISKVASFDEITFGWQTDAGFDEYKVKVVATTGAAHDSGTQIPTTAGSANVSGTAGSYPATTTITTTINGADLETASAGDGTKIVKVFVYDGTNWSV